MNKIFGIKERYSKLCVIYYNFEGHVSQYYLRDDSLIQDHNNLQLASRLLSYLQFWLSLGNVSLGVAHHSVILYFKV